MSGDGRPGYISRTNDAGRRKYMILQSADIWWLLLGYPVAAFVVAVTFSPSRRDKLAAQHNLLYRGLVAVACVISLVMAGEMIAWPFLYASVAKDVSNYPREWIFTVVSFPIYIVGGIMLWATWALLVELLRRDPAGIVSGQHAASSSSGHPSATKRLSAMLVVILAALTVADAAWQIPLRRWVAHGKPVTDMEDRSYSPLHQGVYIVNGKPIVMHDSASPDNMMAVGDVKVTVFSDSQPKASRHVFHDVTGKWWQSWEIALHGHTTIKVEAEQTTGPYSGVWNVEMPDNRKIILVLQFFRAKPRLLVYDTTYPRALLATLNGR
jgi:hypothetical protein